MPDHQQATEERHNDTNDRGSVVVTCTVALAFCALLLDLYVQMDIPRLVASYERMRPGIPLPHLTYKVINFRPAAIALNLLSYGILISVVTWERAARLPASILLAAVFLAKVGFTWWALRLPNTVVIMVL